MSDPDSGPEDVVAALKEFGFSTYEAETLLALQRLGVGSARDVHELSGVPRSQVYGAAESLAAVGLVDVQQTNPQVYRPAPVEEVRARLERRFESRYELVVEHLSDLERGRRAANEQRQDVWRVAGAASVSSRVLELLKAADTEAVYVVGEGTLVTGGEVSTVRSLVDRGVEVTLVTESARTRDRFAGTGADIVVPSTESESDDGSGSTPVGRILFVDDDGLLLSVHGADETAIWSLDTMFARTLSDLVRGSLASFVGGCGLRS